MTDPASFRDSTQIVIPEGVAHEIRQELESQFTVSVHEDGDGVRIIGSPVEIKGVNNFLVRNGITLP